MVLDVRMGDVLRMRRPHPCGGLEWEVVRVGADIGLRCGTCGHRVMMDRAKVARRVKALVKRGAPLDPAIERALYGDADGGQGEDSARPLPDEAAGRLKPR